MLERKVALRYAKSLFKIARDEKEMEDVKIHFEKLLKIFEENDLWKIFKYPKINIKEKKEILEKIPVPLFIRNFIFILLEKKRINLLPLIFEEYCHILEKYLKIAKGEIISAIKLGEEEKNLLKEKIEKLLNKKVILEERIDKNIIGGVVVKVENTFIDGSIKTALERLKNQLVK